MIHILPETCQMEQADGFNNSGKLETALEFVERFPWITQAHADVQKLIEERCKR